MTMSEHLRDLASLQSHYEDVIQTHKHLATVFSSLIGTVVNGRLPGHDLAAMLRDLAEREELMAANWGFVRDGLIEKLRSGVHEWTIEVATDVDSDEDTEDDDRAATRYELDSPWKGIEEDRQQAKQSSIASHLANELANAVKSGPGEDYIPRLAEDAETQTRQEQPIPNNVEHEAQVPEWLQLKAEARAKIKKHHQTKKRECEDQIDQIERMNPVTYQHRKKRKCGAARRRLARTRAALSQGTPAEAESMRPKRLEKERLDRERKAIAEYQASEKVRRSQEVVRQYSPVLVRAADGRIIKQEPDD